MMQDVEIGHVADLYSIKIGDYVYINTGWKYKFDQQAARIAVLEAQVTALRKIAISERSGCIRTESYDHCEGLYAIDLPDAIESASRQLAKEYPEAFR